MHVRMEGYQSLGFIYELRGLVSNCLPLGCRKVHQHHEVKDPGSCFTYLRADVYLSFNNCISFFMQVARDCHIGRRVHFQQDQ